MTAGWKGMTRRMSLGLMGALALGIGAPRPALANARRRLLRAVETWAAQYQDIDLAAVAASNLDLIVLEPSLDDYYGTFIRPDDLVLLKRKPDGGRRLVLAYLPVGETDTKRWYWPPQWRQNPPDWVGPDNPDWPGSRHVRYWNAEWRGLVFEKDGSLLDRILETGYDGVLLDRVDAYFDWRHERPTAQDDMIDLIAAIRQRVDAARADFILMPQNAEHLMLHPRYLALIDGINKESLLSGLAGENRLNTAEDVAWSLGHLQRAERAGVVLFATEYATDPPLKEKLGRRIRELGLKPFLGVRALDRL